MRGVAAHRRHQARLGTSGGLVVGVAGGERVKVILPDAAAGCSLADMADIDQVEDCWQQLAAVIDVEDLMPARLALKQSA